MGSTELQRAENLQDISANSNCQRSYKQKSATTGKDAVSPLTCRYTCHEREHKTDQGVLTKNRTWRKIGLQGSLFYQIQNFRFRL